MRQTFSFATTPICYWNKTYMHSTSISLTVSWQLFYIKYSKSQLLLHILFRYFIPPTHMLAILFFFLRNIICIFIDFALWNNPHGENNCQKHLTAYIKSYGTKNCKSKSCFRRALFIIKYEDPSVHIALFLTQINVYTFNLSVSTE